MEFTDEKKKELEKQIVDICISVLENNSLTEKEMGDVSFFVLERIDLIKTHGDLIEFLKKLSDRWSIFKSLLEIEKGKEEVEEDKIAAEKVEKLIKQGDLNQAISVAEEANK